MKNSVSMTCGILDVDHAFMSALFPTVDWIHELAGTIVVVLLMGSQCSFLRWKVHRSISNPLSSGGRLVTEYPGRQRAWGVSTP